MRHLRNFILFAFLAELERESSGHLTRSGAATESSELMMTSAVVMTTTSAKEGFEDLIGVDVATEATVASTAFEIVDVAAVVVTRSLLGVGEDAVGLADLLEFFLMLLLLFLRRT